VTTIDRSGRAAVGANAAIAVALVVLLAAVALVAKPPAPPGIAEFAPQAAQAITKAPPGQSSQFGRGATSCSGGPCLGLATTTTLPGATTTVVPVTTPGAPVIAGVPSSLQCFTWPDGAVTQTFDPQSPPCVPDWPQAARGNGGATSPGVTATSIRIGIAGSSSEPPAAALLTFFNQHFELYGRQLVAVDDAVASTGIGPQYEHAQAVQDLEDHEFAAIFGDYTQDDDLPYLSALAQERVIGVNAYSTNVTTRQLVSMAPFAWSYYPTVDQQELNLGQFSCRALVGHPASQAGESSLRSATRSFAVLYPDPDGANAIPVGTLQSALGTCGASLPSDEYEGYVQADAQGVSQPSQQNDELMLALKSKGVTTVYVTGRSVDTFNALSAANLVGYHPEWVIFNTADYYDGAYTATAPTQLSSMSGIAYWNKELPAITDVGDESFSEEAAPINWSDEYESLYKALLLVASGIQAAGPDLTPTTFANGLDNLAFPNPEADSAPTFPARVGFSKSSPAMVDDFGLWSWQPGGMDYSAAPAARNTGAYCYVGGGKRWSLGSWPTQDPWPAC